MPGPRKPARKQGRPTYAKLDREQVKLLLGFRPEVAEALKELDLKVTDTGQIVKMQAPFGVKCRVAAAARAPFGVKCRVAALRAPFGAKCVAAVPPAAPYGARCTELVKSVLMPSPRKAKGKPAGKKAASRRK
jgi:hypothetical protein